MQFGQLKRREFLTLLGGAAAWAAAARAQQTDKVPTIGLLGSGTASAQSQWTAAFVTRLREIGWTERRNIAIEYRWAEGRSERYSGVVAELVGRKVDVIVTQGTPIVIAAKADLSAQGQLAREALDNVQAYFGNAPFPVYTVQLELLRPLAGHKYGFSQEHINSGTFTLPTAEAITNRSSVEDKQVTLLNYAHHMAHCWIPKRSYGTGYLPFTWEMPPLIDTIWFNEGFARYAAIAALAEAMPAAQGTEFRERQLQRLRHVLDEAPTFIREMPLLELSREASFMYALDFRMGKNIYSRGGLMAAEMDDRIRSRTSGKRSLRDSLRFLLDWTERNQRAFETQELGRLLSQSAGVDVQDILARWMKANPRPLD